VDKVVFVGSPGVGVSVARAASSSLTPVVLELGGKDPFVVCEDVSDINGLVQIACRGVMDIYGHIYYICGLMDISLIICGHKWTSSSTIWTIVDI